LLQKRDVFLDYEYRFNKNMTPQNRSGHFRTAKKADCQYITMIQPHRMIIRWGVEKHKIVLQDISKSGQSHQLTKAIIGQPTGPTISKNLNQKLKN
jgi:hypothetical protein